MRVTVSGGVDIGKEFAASGKRVQPAMVRAVRGGGDALKLGLRDQTTRAGLGPRVGNAWRAKVYDVDTASLVYTRAGPIIEGFDKGGVIRPRESQALTIPLPVAGKGPKGGRITPEEFTRRTGIRLVFRPVGRGNLIGLLVAQQTSGRKFRLAKSGQLRGRQRPQGKFRLRYRAGLPTVPVFLVVRNITLQKRLDVAGEADRGQVRLAELVGDELVQALIPSTGRTE